MSIPYVRTIEHLSPSSLQMLEQDPITFYLRKLGPPELVPANEEQGFPAAVGTAFDAGVKVVLSATLGLPCPPHHELYNKVTTEKERAIAFGHDLVMSYAKCGALAALVAQRPIGVEVHPERVCAPGTDTPISGQLDATLRLRKSRTLVVHDWKVSGANRPGEASPRQGYVAIYDTEKPGVRLPGHAKAGCYFEEIEERWATQLTIYGWLMGHPIRERSHSIDELVVGRNGRLRVALFRAKVSVAFQKQVRERLVAAWAKVTSNTVIPPEYGRLALPELLAMR